MAWSLVGGTVGATCLSNVLRVLLNCNLKQRLPIVTSAKSREIISDISAVLKVKQTIRAESETKATQESLKENDLQCENSSDRAEDVKFHQIELFNTATKRLEVPDSARLSFVAVPRTAFTVKKETSTNELF